MEMSGNTILITGGTSGIGKQLALRFSALGNKVIIAGRRHHLIEDIRSLDPQIAGYELDVEDKVGLEAFAAIILREHPDLNVLVNNAGIMRLEDIAKARDLSDAETTISTNLLAPIRLTNALVEHLSGKRDAAIVNVSSGLAFVPLVAAPTYSATKAAIHSYTMSLREALKGRIEVIELTPPAVQTDLTPGQSTRPGYLPLDEFMNEVMVLFAGKPTPGEILVERVKFQRFAEAENRLARTFAQLNEFARQARQA